MEEERRKGPSAKPREEEERKKFLPFRRGQGLA
jgi:hypothetical protein